MDGLILKIANIFK